jgi:hypothetical protein
MNSEIIDNFESKIAHAVRPIVASPRRKRVMREELLAHLIASYSEELSRVSDPEVALGSAIRRFGNVDELREQLQAAVPRWERAVYECFDRKELLMRYLFAIAALVAFVASQYNANTAMMMLQFGGIAVMFAIVAWHLRRKDNLADRWIGPRRWPWVFGIAAALFGTSIILPALALLNLGRRSSPQIALPLGLGFLITFWGLFVIVNAIVARRRPPHAQ